MNIEDLLRRLIRNDREGEWLNGDGDNDSEWEEGQRRRPTRGNVKIPRLPLIAAAVVLLVLMGFTRFVDFYVDILWYESLGLVSALWRRILPQAVLVVLYTLITFVVYSFCWRRAMRIGTEEFAADTGSDVSLVQKRYVIACAAVLALMDGLGFRSNWHVVMQYLNRTEFGEVDAIFGNDIGFYVFSLPLLNILLRWAMTLAMISLIGSVVMFLLCRSLRSDGGRIVLIRRARFHLLAIASVFLAALGVRLWFSRYDLLYSPTGIVFGMGYTDLHVRLPGLAILSITAIAASVMVVINIYRPLFKAAVI
ncbi:MAG: UPF0182 family protein, partial [Synergistaceae bacterium]|nr:UPF0182 family protein [Synergistaceae bacterium]